MFSFGKLAPALSTNAFNAQSLSAETRSGGKRRKRRRRKNRRRGRRRGRRTTN